MSDVFIFGAGASMEYRGACGPLFCDKDFFQVVEKMWTTGNRANFRNYDGGRLDWPRLKQFVEKRFNRPVESIGLEEAFVEVDGMEQDLEDLFCRCIELALFWRMRGTSPQNLYTHCEFLRRVLRPGGTLITFNYDPILEYALTHIAHCGTISWNPVTGYGLPFKKEFSGGHLRELTTKQQSNVSLFKLHGSMNWLFFYGESPSQPRYLLRFTNDSLLRGVGFKIMVEETSSTVLRPLFVPPKSAKDYESYGLTELWNKAEQALENPTSLTVIGYRFPKTDAGALELIRKAEHLAESTRVTYVTDNKEAAATFSEYFSKAYVDTRGFAAYVTQPGQDRQN